MKLKPNTFPFKRNKRVYTFTEKVMILHKFKNHRKTPFPPLFL